MCVDERHHQILRRSSSEAASLLVGRQSGPLSYVPPRLAYPQPQGLWSKPDLACNRGDRRLLCDILALVFPDQPDCPLPTSGESRSCFVVLPTSQFCASPAIQGRFTTAISSRSPHVECSQGVPAVRKYEFVEVLRHGD
jgi:hypothetical protein